jgi:hypothetical protein
MLWCKKRVLPALPVHAHERVEVVGVGARFKRLFLPAPEEQLVEVVEAAVFVVTLATLEAVVTPEAAAARAVQELPPHIIASP